LRNPVLADVFLGKITRWSDSAITGLNPSLKLPDAPIAVVHRSERSGTTFNFTDYLSKVTGETACPITATVFGLPPRRHRSTGPSSEAGPLLHGRYIVDTRS
jgi:ABC-type phosphate transport system substrate-binding protein